MGIRHKFRSPISDDGIPAGEVKPTNWNDDHEADGYIGAVISLALAANSYAYLDADELPQLGLLTAVGRAILAGNTPADVLSYLGGAPLDNAALTGAPSAPTPPVGDGSTRIATMAAVQAAIANLVASSPAALDTLNELANALGNDPNFSTTITTALGNRVRFDAAQSLAAGQRSQVYSNIGLGNVVTYNVGTGASNIVQLDASSKLPAVDGSALTNVTVSWANVSGRPTIGTAPGNVVALDGAGKLPAVDGSQLTNVAAGGVRAQCRLLLSGGNVVLMPFGGNVLTINGVQCTIADAGVSASAAGLTPATLYYVYATASGATVNALEFSATAHATDTAAGNKGNEVKSGDSTRTFVGIVRPIAGPAFADTVTQRFVRSFWNRRSVTLVNSFTTGRSTTSTVAVEINPEIRCEFLIFADEVADFSEVGTVYNSNANTATYSYIAFDGTAEASRSGGNSAVANADVAANARAAKNLSEGYHYVTILGSVNPAGTGNWYGGAAHQLIGRVGL